MDSMYKLLDVTKCILQDREEQYGSPVDSFRDIADIWGDYLQYPMNQNDVITLLIMMKLVRAKNNPEHIDSWIDIAGYAAICGGLYSKNQDISHPEQDQQSTEHD